MNVLYFKAKNYKHILYIKLKYKCQENAKYNHATFGNAGFFFYARKWFKKSSKNCMTFNKEEVVIFDASAERRKEVLHSECLAQCIEKECTTESFV